MSEEALEGFRAAVLADTGLQRRLRGLGRDEFLRQAVAAAAELGHDLSVEEVEAALRGARSEWLERWI